MSGLDGLVVLEIADTPGAAFAVSLLADYGATAVVCEPPEGSALRRLGPKLLHAARWKILARNKQSAAADWNDPANGTLMRRLLTRADMVVTDLAKPRQAGNPWFAALNALPEAERPLVVEVFPTGADRPDLWPWSTRPEFAGAASGVMALTGHTGKTPIHAEAPLTDYLAGALAAAKALTRLRTARLTHAALGEVEVPLHLAVQRMIEWQTPVATAKGRAETRMANNFPMNAGIANMHPTGDGKYVAISAVTQATAVRLMNMVGGPELCADPRFATAEARSSGLAPLYEKIDTWTGARTTPQILETAAEQDVVLGPIYTTDDILADEQVAAREAVVTAGGLRMPAVTPRMTGVDGAIRNLGPGAGEHSRKVAALMEQSPPPGLPHRGGGLGGSDAPGSELKVIELGAVIAGPFAGSLMAELGGRVIKVETPGAGDSLRGMGPQMQGLPLWFAASARDKECVTINLKHPDGKAMLLKLIAGADVLVENFRPGVLDRLGLGWEALKEINPRLVMLSISGFGQTGPQATRPGFGKIAEGLSGIVSLTGEVGQAPLFVGFSLADASAGLFGIYAVTAALYRRDILGGGGARIDLALFEPLMRMLDCQFAVHEMTGKPPERSGSNDPYGFGVADAERPPLRAAVSATGDWYLIAPGDAAASARLESMNLDGLPNAKLEAALRDAGVDFAPVFDGMTIANSPYFRARGDVVTMEHPLLGTISAAGRLSGPSGCAPFRAPGLGEDNEIVFKRELCLSDTEIARLKAEGAI